MPTYLCMLGREPELSIAEFSAVLEEHNISYSELAHRGEFLFVEVQGDIPSEELMKQLGGMVLIAKDQSIPVGVHAIADLLESITSVGKITFSLHSKKHATPLALSIKKELKSRGRSVRYVAPKNTATIIHNKLANAAGDLHIHDGKVFLTEAVQDIEGFSKRDYDRPRIDSKSGMLPPKLSRMMINLAGGKSISSLHDPFCGSGTVLMEAMSLGIPHVSGSDLSQKAVDDSRTNVYWLTKEIDSQCQASVEQVDAMHLSDHLKPASVQTIVCEPYMGTPLKGKESANVLQKQAQELASLYEAVLKEFHTVLVPGGKVVMIFPSFHWKNTWISTAPEHAIKKFSVQREHLRYHRPGQHLARDIWVLTKS